VPGALGCWPVRLSGRPGRRPAVRWREGSGVVMVSDGLVRRWEAVYREYGAASAMVSASEPGDRDVAARMARASRNVAAVWREMAGESDVDWWAVAALSAAAQAFEYQERDWSARAKLEGPVVAGPVRRVHPAVAGGRHALGGVADAG
jgi:hypothetical protein